MPELSSVVFFAGVSLLSAAFGLWVASTLIGARSLQSTKGIVFADAPRRYEFRQGYLLSAIDPNDAFLRVDTDRSTAFDLLSRALKPLNPDLPARFAGLARRGEAFLLPATFGQDLLSIAGRLEDDRLVITIGPSEPGSGRQVIDGATLLALNGEIGDLRHGLDGARCPIWRMAPDGGVVWANAAYVALAERLMASHHSRAPWALPNLFADHLDPPPEPGSLRRCHLPLLPHDPAIATAHEGALWFEIAVTRQSDDSLWCTALPSDRLVGAEISLRNFVQTLSKTFAQLPIGLAIFDKRRELVLFNPSLVTLSTLSPQFLSARPGFFAFLDALRDHQRMPEPKNYRSWRDEIARLERGAEDGTFQELWTLPGGQSFRVIGRPHPDGALAFMFEDITAEVSLTRKFRGDLDLHQSLLDTLPQAIAVFAADGRLALANTAYAKLWQVDLGAIVGALTVRDAIRDWQAQANTSDAWVAISNFSNPQPDRAAWDRGIVLTDGRALHLDVTPLSGGAMMVGFHHRAHDPATPCVEAPFPAAFAPPPAPVQPYFAEATADYRPACDGKE
ncbi:PAS domain-containing protein [Rhodobacterales bacterium LSUCC0031]|nr:PAS domain-containing protein [Rhodobacterales bacterium LSUCC0031]